MSFFDRKRRRHVPNALPANPLDHPIVQNARGALLAHGMSLSDVEDLMRPIYQAPAAEAVQRALFILGESSWARDRCFPPHQLAEHFGLKFPATSRNVRMRPYDWNTYDTAARLRYLEGHHEPDEATRYTLQTFGSKPWGSSILKRLPPVSDEELAQTSDYRLSDLDDARVNQILARPQEARADGWTPSRSRVETIELHRKRHAEEARKRALAEGNAQLGETPGVPF